MSFAEEALAAAEGLGEQIWECRVRDRDDQIAWLRPGSEARGEAVSLVTRADPFLYDGTAGIALFLAALAHVTGDETWRGRSLQALLPVRRMLARITAGADRAARLGRLGIGGLIGLGSLFYSFLRIGRLSDEPLLLDEAQGLAAMMTPERIRADSACDILYGSAGAILALLALSREAGGGPWLEAAGDCARNLLDRRESFEGGPRTWRSLPGLPPLGGFSHGAAGISYALLRLLAQTGGPGLLGGAEEGLAFERTLYSPKGEGWRDAKSTEAARYSAGWCLGAAGEVIARLPARELLAAPEIEEELALGLEITRSAPPETVDHLCCGTMGRAESLLFASEALGDEALGQAAEELARSVLARRDAAGSFRWRKEMSSDLFDPTFFTGASGVGYTLLRLAAPRRLPCVLALD